LPSIWIWYVVPAIALNVTSLLKKQLSVGPKL
jgi:hypothetical protein